MFGMDEKWKQQKIRFGSDVKESGNFETTFPWNTSRPSSVSVRNYCRLLCWFVEWFGCNWLSTPSQNQRHMSFLPFTFQQFSAYFFEKLVKDWNRPSLEISKSRPTRRCGKKYDQTQRRFRTTDPTRQPTQPRRPWRPWGQAAKAPGVSWAEVRGTRNEHGTKRSIIYMDDKRIIYGCMIRWFPFREILLRYMLLDQLGFFQRLFQG